MPGFTLEDISKGLATAIRMRIEGEFPGTVDPELQKMDEHFYVWTFPWIPLQPEDLAFSDELFRSIDALKLREDNKDVSAAKDADMLQLRLRLTNKTELCLSEHFPLCHRAT